MALDGVEMDDLPVGTRVNVTFENGEEWQTQVTGPAPSTNKIGIPDRFKSKQVTVRNLDAKPPHPDQLTFDFTV